MHAIAILLIGHPPALFNEGIAVAHQTDPGSSFVRYLIDTYGLAPLKAYFGSSTFDDSAATVEARFLTAYGRTVASVWEEWRAAIR